MLFLLCCSCPSKILDRQNDVVEVVGRKLLVLVGRKLLDRQNVFVELVQQPLNYKSQQVFSVV